MVEDRRGLTDPGGGGERPRSRHRDAPAGAGWRGRIGRLARTRATPRARPPTVIGAVFGLPVAVFLALFFVVPLVAIVRHAGTDGLGPAARVLPFTLLQASLSTVATLAIGLPAAFALGRYDFPGRRLVAAVITAPFVLPTVVVGAALLALARPGLPAILLAHTLFNVSVVVRTVGSAWTELDVRLGEAAKTLGATPWRAARTITFPLLGPAIGSAAAIVFLFSFTSFGVIRLLGGPAQRTLETEIYRQTADLLRLDRAATLALVQLGVVAVLLWASGRRSFAQTRLSITQRTPTRPFVCVAAVIVPLMLAVVPMVVLVERSLRDPGRSGHSLRSWRALARASRGSGLVDAPLSSITTSLRIAVVAAAVATTLGLAAAVALSRAARPPRLLDLVVMAPLGTSAVTLGFGFLVANPLGLRSKWIAIPVVHALIGMPFVVRAVGHSLRSVDPRVRDAAATLGARPWRVFATIDLPIARRPLMVGGAMALAVSLGEFGAASFLVRPTSATLPVAIGRLLSRPGSVNVGQAYALAVILAVLTGGVMIVVEGLSA